MPGNPDRETRWYKLDNTAKMYPLITSAKNSYVYRIAINLNQEIEPKVLQQAVEDCKPRFPTIYVRMRKGLFWYYHEANEKMPLVKPEPSVVCEEIVPSQNNGYYFTFFYYRNRISLEMFHVLCDGSGALAFLKLVVFRYLELLGLPVESEGLILSLDEEPKQSEIEDSYVENYESTEGDRGAITRAYHTSGTYFSQGGIGIINGKMKTEQLKRLAKDHGASISQYLAALLTYCIIETGDMKKLSRLPVNICIPVDMRKYYSSKTLRNFFLNVFTSVFCGGRKMSFETALDLMKEQFKSGVDLEKLQKLLNSNVSVEKNPIVRFSPLFLKLALIKIGYKFGGRMSTTAIMSNIGNVEIPESMKPYIIDMDMNFNINNLCAHNLGIVSCKGITTLGFSRRVYETELERLFFTHLTSRGVEVEILSNLWEDFA